MPTSDGDEQKMHDLEEQARALQALIDEARRLQDEIQRHLRTVRRQALPYRVPDRGGKPR